MILDGFEISDNKPIVDPGNVFYPYPKSDTGFFKDAGKISSTIPTIFIDPSRWHEVWPYEIVARKLTDTSDGYPLNYTYSLPIPPEAITINPVIASEATATLGGVVEETSKNVFWNISFQGTTGIVSRRKNVNEMPSEFRETVGRLGMISGALQEAGEFIQGGVDRVADIASDPVNGLIDSMQTRQWFRDSVVDRDWNGYAEILLLHKFLNAYSHIKDVDPGNWELYFIHHKMQMMWRIVVKEFRILQSKDRPFLYQYSFTFKAWDVSDPMSKWMVTSAVDRFKTDLKYTNAFNLLNTLKKVRKTINKLRRMCTRVKTEVNAVGRRLS